MKILITYHTETKNTQLLANTLYQHITGNHLVELKTTTQTSPSTLNNYDLVFLGSPCHNSDLATPVKQLLKEMPANPNFKLAGFYCHSTYKRDAPYPEAESMFDQWAADGIKTYQTLSKEKNAKLLGVFNCMGAPSEDIQTFIHTAIVTDENDWEIYKNEVLKHPTSEDLEALRSFADQIISSAE